MSQNKLENILKEKLSEDGVIESKFVLAVSGGVDSMVLLDLFVKVLANPLAQIVVVNFDHQTRPETKFEAEIVERICRKHGLEFKFFLLDIDATKNFEAEARRLRYLYLKEVRCLFEADYIVTAHHQDDQVETVFLNFIKGSFVDGMAGLAAFDGSRHLYRPLLGVKKFDLRKYAKNEAIIYSEDSSNVDTKYLRNFIRLEIVPEISKRVGSMNSIARNAQFYSELSVYLDSQLVSFINEKVIDNTVFRSDLLDLPDFMRFKLYTYFLKDYDLSVADFEQLDKVVTAGNSGKLRVMGDVEFKVIAGKKILISNL
jgi:tRNA(Ile)-lysidine synthase